MNTPTPRDMEKAKQITFGFGLFVPMEEHACERLRKEIAQALAEEREAERRAVLEADELKNLLAYTTHTPFCGHGQTGMGQCECFYKEALRRFEELKKGME